MKNDGYMYDLIGVVTKSTEIGSSGNIIAYCKSPINKIWYGYKDDFVFRVNNYISEVINPANPHILFYQKIK